MDHKRLIQALTLSFWECSLVVTTFVDLNSTVLELLWGGGVDLILAEISVKLDIEIMQFFL